MKRFNCIYNGDKKKALGKGYYIIFENHKGKPIFDTFYKTWNLSSEYEGINADILGRIKYIIDIGYKFDTNYTCDVEELFK